MEKLLLLHGALGAEAQFEKLRHLLSADYEIHSFDFYGHGKKSAEGKALEIEGFADQVAAWLNENKLEKINIFGYSMGGYVALRLALNHPEKVIKIFTLATKFDWNEETAAKEVKMLDPEKIEAKIPAFATDLAQRHGQENWKTVLRKTADMMLNLGQTRGVLQNLAQLETPVRISIGDRDMMVSLEETIDVYRQLKNGSLLVLPNTMHPLEKVNLERLTFELKQFFN